MGKVKSNVILNPSTISLHSSSLQTKNEFIIIHAFWAGSDAKIQLVIKNNMFTTYK